jgi:hypothetical protein
LGLIESVPLLEAVRRTSKWHHADVEVIGARQ